MNLPILDSSHKWNRTVFILLHNVFEVHPCSIMYKNLIPLYARIIVHCMYSHSSADAFWSRVAKQGLSGDCDRRYPMQCGALGRSPSHLGLGEYCCPTNTTGGDARLLQLLHFPLPLKATEINEVKFDIYLQNGFLLPSSQLNFKLSFCSQVVNEDENEYQLSVCQLLC